MPYLYKRVRTPHRDFVTRTKCFYINAGDGKRPRRARMSRTDEGKAERNRRDAYKKRMYEIYNNFDKGDFWVTLTWQADKLGGKSPEEAHRVLLQVLQKIRRVLQRAGLPFVYYAKTEAGVRTRVHHHILIKNSPQVLDLLFKLWKGFGKVKDFQEIYDFESGKLVKYFLDGGDHKELEFIKYSHSRNLVQPEVEKHIYPFESFRTNPRPPKPDGIYRWEVRNLYNGFPDLDGYIYQEYELVKIRIGGGDV